MATNPPQSGVGVLHFGLGEIGAVLVKATAKAEGLRSVAAVDVRKELVGRSLQDLFGAGGAVTVHGSLAEAKSAGAQVAFHAAGSYLVDIEGQLRDLVDAGLNVVTTSEELIHPCGAAAEAAARVGRAAEKAGVTVFPAGVNPGFLMDRLPAYVSSMCIAPRAVTVRRIVDLGIRRNALRRKMGVGAQEGEIRARIEARKIGHVGLVESLAYLAAALGWKIGEITEHLEPLMAEARVERAGEVVEPGRVLGLRHTASAADGSGRRIDLELIMRIDAETGVDEIEIDAEVPLRLAIPGGLNGDTATVASVLNAARMTVAARPGLLRELSVPAANVY